VFVQIRMQKQWEKVMYVYLPECLTVYSLAVTIYRLYILWHDNKRWKMYTWNQIEGFHGKYSVQQDEDASHQHVGLISKEKTNKMLYLEHCFIWRWQLDTSEIRSETPVKFFNVFEWWRRSVEQVLWEIKYYIKLSRKEISYVQYKKGRLTGLVTCWVAIYNWRKDRKKVWNEGKTRRKV